ncbi:MAG: LLM class flavin-dependent oxidoreductase [Hyphomicrobiales bacterium]|nr:LLM class flavin-dependent oxidoreductase [Hyphomicrobiales bacterium]
MKIGYMGAGILDANGAERRETVERLEEAGFDHIGFGDHVSFFVGLGFDGLLATSGLLSASDRLGVVLGVYLLPLRHPVLVARQVADLAASAPGRLVLGVGIGGEDRHEVEICGVDPATRGRRMDECLQVVRGLLAGEAFDFDGEFFQLEAALIAPAPTVSVPLVVGGRSDAAVERAGRYGDGYFGIWASPRRYGEAVTRMEEVAASAGRSVDRWDNCLNVWCGVGETAEKARSHLAPAMEAMYQIPFESFDRWSPYGRPEDIAEFLAPYAVAGCGHINLIIQGESADAQLAGAAEVRDLLAGV